MSLKTITLRRFLSMLLVGSALINNAFAQNKTPNIILIMADDMGRECIGAYGSTYKTPNIDKLAKEGLKFNYAFAQPLCTPSRVQIMTGKYNYRNYSEFGHLNQDQKTFAHLAKDAGYTTAIAGKWQLGANQKLPKHFGFDQYCLWQLSKPRREGERYAKPLIDKDGEILKTTDDDYGPDIFVNYMLDFIEKNKDKKFLAYYPMALVHDPFLPTPDSKSWKTDVAGRHKKDTLNFRDMVAYSDKNVGKIIQKLKDLNIYDNTIIIFTGDNGTGKAIVTPLQDGSKIAGGKGLTLDRGHHVPLIVNWGKYKYAKHELNYLFDFTDVMPTIAEAIQTQVPASWGTDKGVSILPLLTNKPFREREWIFSHYSPIHSEGANKHAARFFRNHRYKLYSDGRFYDLKADIEEKQPIAAGKAGAEGEKVRKNFEAELAKLPAWKFGDPGVAKVVLPGLESDPSFADKGD
ncbi:sulfatase-like hydrolase/transferase [Dyadobacter sp. CY326]|uniref:sulfatase-like hydrolase/transferase n=1 Tax=Dyadobacter sp. CY326 TaxID=2907300 RepID=UPI001F399E64|nr:sulfatase-like hydrolase/transferase [Dyadobacter sp. CY326]MCE7065912.1 sulfatase-like hydrolase/transferase [Dyadobacter sp. CY326]